MDEKMISELRKNSAQHWKKIVEKYGSNEKDTVLEQLSMEELKKHCDLFEEDVYHAISLDTCVKERRSAGGPAPEEVKKQIACAKETLAALL